MPAKAGWNTPQGKPLRSVFILKPNYRHYVCHYPPKHPAKEAG